MKFITLVIIFGSLVIPGLAAAASCPIYQEAKVGVLRGDDIGACSCEQLDLLRNEIYARHGRKFKRKDLNDYFKTKSWYVPIKGKSGAEGQNKFEKKNVALIKSHEDGRGCKAADTSDIINGLEDGQILTAARKYVNQSTPSEVRFKLKVIRRIGRWALIDVIPLGKFEGAGVVMEKVNGRWVGRDLGTDLTEWETKAPELFN